MIKHNSDNLASAPAASKKVFVETYGCQIETKQTMCILNRKNYAWLLLVLFVLGCGNAGNKEDAGSAISGVFVPSETEKNNSKERKDQIEDLKNQAQQMQKDRLGSY